MKLCFLVGSLNAATYTWDDVTGDSAIADGVTNFSNWQVGVANWYDATTYDQVWADGNDAVFGGGAAGTAGTVTLGGNVSTNTLTINAANAGNYDIDVNASTLTLANSTGAMTVNDTTTISSSGVGSLVTTGSNTRIGTNGAKYITISSLVTGAGRLAFAGSGGGTLSNDSNSFSGDFSKQNSGSVSFSTVKNIGVNSALGAGDTITFGYNGHLKYTGTGDTSNRTLNPTGTSNATLSNYGTDALIFNGTFTSSITGAGIFTLNGDGGAGALSDNEIQSDLSDNGGNALNVSRGGISKWILSGNNTYTGFTKSINGQTLYAGSTTAFGTNSQLILTNNGDIALNGFSNSFGSLTHGVSYGGSQLENASTMTDATVTTGGDNTDATFDVLIRDGTGTKDLLLTKVGTGEQTLTATNTYTGATTINGGKLIISADSGIGTGPTSATAGHLTLNGGTLETTASFTLDSDRGIALGASHGTIETAAATTLTYGGIAAGAGNLTKTGTGILLLSGANTYTGATTVSAGTLQAGSTSAFGSNSAMTVTGTLELDGNSNSIGSLAGAGTVENANAGAATLTTGGDNTSTAFSGVIQDGAGGGALSLVKNGTGTLTLSGTNTFTGDTTISAGELSISSAGSLGSGTYAGAIANSATLTVDTSANQTLSGVISGTGALTKSSTGTLTLGNTSANTYTGGTTIDAGILSLGSGGGLTSHQDALGTGSVTVNSGAEVRLWIQNTGSFTIDNAFTLDGGSIHAEDGIYDLSGAMTLAAGGGTLSAKWDGKSPTVSGVISGAGALTIDERAGGNGSTVILGNTSANTYTGGTTIDGGILSLGSGGGLTSHQDALGTGSVTVNSGAEVRLWIQNTGSFTIDNSFTLDGGTIHAEDGIYDVSGNITLAAGGGTLSSKWLTKDPLFSGVISGAGALTIDERAGGNGSIVKLSGTNTYTGNTTIGAGTLNVTSAGSLGSGTYAGAIANSGTLTFDTSADQTLSGVISGTGALNKSSTGTLTLSNTNTYTGLTTATAGILSLTGSIGGGLTVNGGIVTTDTSGSVGGALTMTTGSISPGTRTSNGTLNIASNSTWTGGTYVWSVSGGMGDSGANAASGGGDTYNEASGGVGTDWDYMAFTGSLDFAGASAGSITIEIDSNGTYTGYEWDKTTEVEIIGASSIANFDASFFTLDSSGFDDATGAWWVGWSIASHDNALWLQYKAVPEPSTYVMILALFMLPIYHWRKKRKL